MIFPEVVEPLSDLSLKDGDKAIFTCRISAPNDATVSWFHGDKLIKPNADFKQIYKDQVATLTIAEVFPDDEGKYRCEVISDNGVAQTSARLIINGKWVHGYHFYCWVNGKIYRV